MKKTFALILLMLALPAFAHPGHDSNPLQDGLLHPLTGLDHLLMLLGTGVLAALTGAPGPAAGHLAAMFGGAVCGHLFGDVLGMEQMILVPAGGCRGGAAAQPPVAAGAGHAGVRPVPWLGPWRRGHAKRVLAVQRRLRHRQRLLLAAGFAVGCLLRRHAGLQKAFGGGLLAGAALVLAG
jgi:urease accessory protein